MILLEHVLCHADIHTGNVMVGRDGELFVVDWDGPALAPKERDLMFVIGGVVPGVVGAREEDLFFKGYGQVDVNPLALAYYRYAWAVQDVGEYAEQVFLMNDLGDKTREHAVHGFRELFQPGAIVELAFQSEQNLPPEHAEE
jgi:spectinomycin phosphotransferase